MDESWDFIALQASPIEVTAVLAAVEDEQTGGVAFFLGMTRRETKSGLELLGLDYEAYPEMALRQMRAIAHKAREKFPVRKLAIVHRTGPVPVGKPSVVVAASGVHRAEAFEACRFCIDALKKEVAIWKKEVWSDGSGSWSEPKSGD